MFNEATLHKHPSLIPAFTGIPAEEFWDMVEKMEAKLPDHEIERHTRDDRKRAVGAGRKFDQALTQRTVAVLSYLRLHVPQLVIALMFGLTQCDISRDLRRLLPLINSVLPCPEVWEITKNNQESKELVVLPSKKLANGRALVDATEQGVSRPGKSNETRKLYYSGKKKAFTIKTQMLTDDDHHILAISALSAVRIRVEHCIGWVKNWAIVATRFRCSHLIYTSVMQTVCGLVNVQTKR